MTVAPQTAADLVEQIFDLQRVVRCIAMASTKGQDAGIALQGVLRFIGAGESRAADLAARLGVSAPVLSRHIADLEGMGLVERRPDPDDGRAQLVTLTPAGTEKVKNFERQHASTLQGYLQDWSQDDAQETATMLKKLAESLRSSARVIAAGPTTATRTN